MNGINSTIPSNETLVSGQPIPRLYDQLVEVLRARCFKLGALWIIFALLLLGCRKNGTDQYNDGAEKYNRGDYQGAITAFTESLRLELTERPSRDDVLAARAAAKLRIGDMNGAMSDSEEARRLNPQNKSALAVIAEVAKNQEPQYNGKPVSYWFAAQSHQDERAEAEAALKAIGTAAVPFLSAKLKDDDWNIRLWAAAGLATIGSGSKSAVPALTAALDDKDSRSLRAVIIALAAIGPESKEALPRIVEAVQNNWNPDIRSATAAALKEIGWNPRDAPYVFKVYSPNGTEVKELTRYCISYRSTVTGWMMLDAAEVTMFSLPGLPKGAKAQLLNQRTGKVEFVQSTPE